MCSSGSLRRAVTTCKGLWDYDGLEPEVVSGCVDPLAETVNAEVDVFSVPTFYRIVMNNEP
jgi:hypothetical protein